MPLKPGTSADIRSVSCCGLLPTLGRPLQREVITTHPDAAIRDGKLPAHITISLSGQRCGRVVINKIDNQIVKARQLSLILLPPDLRCASIVGEQRDLPRPVTSSAQATLVG